MTSKIILFKLLFPKVYIICVALSRQQVKWSCDCMMGLLRKLFSWFCSQVAHKC